MFAGLNQLKKLVKLSPVNIDKILRALDKISTNKRASKIVYGLSIAFFFVLVLLPPIFGIVLKLDKVEEVFQDPVLLDRSRSAISWSFILAFTVAALDILAGLPLAWLIVRRSLKWGSVIDTLADIPFIIPTVALGPLNTSILGTPRATGNPPWTDAIVSWSDSCHASSLRLLSSGSSKSDGWRADRISGKLRNSS